jgi:hypothetical protein
MIRVARFVTASVFSLALAQSGAFAAEDLLLKAMRDELARARSLKVPNLEPPYYIRYGVEEQESFQATAVLGGLVSTSQVRFRMPQAQVRVGSYSFDNTNYVGSGVFFGSRYDSDRLPLDNDYAVLRRFLWLATDVAYKGALEAMARKRAALKNVAMAEDLPDFAQAESVRVVQEIEPAVFQSAKWTDRVRSLSSLFRGYPALRYSQVQLEAALAKHYLVTSEGSEIRVPERVIMVRASAAAQAPDGMLVRDVNVSHAIEFERLASDQELSAQIRTLADTVSRLAAAPRGEGYSGPVLFEGIAASQIFAEVLGRNLALTRRPVPEPGRPAMVPTSELEGRTGSRILPASFDVVDDPTRKEWRGRPLFGSYEVDREAVAAKRVRLVEKGVLRDFLLTRLPVRGFSASNGRARFPGAFGTEAAGISNLLVQTSEAAPLSQLRNRLIEMTKARGNAYDLVVKKMDYPSSAAFDEVQRILASAAQSGISRPVSVPIQVYRLYPDGREELVRGLRFRSLSARSLKDIVAAGDDSNMFEFLDNPAPFALIGAGGYTSSACVIAPSVLIDDLDLQPVEHELPKLPVVPAPALAFR